MCACLYILEKERKKNFRKTNCWKKRNDIAKKKSVYNHHDGEEKKERKKIVLPYTDDEYTNIFKKEICRWNKLLELSADHFSKKKETNKEGRGEEVKQEI